MNHASKAWTRTHLEEAREKAHLNMSLQICSRSKRAKAHLPPRYHVHECVE